MFALYCIVSVLLGIYLYLSWNFNYWAKRGVVSPKPRIILGSLPNVIQRKENVIYDIEKIYNEFKGKLPYVGLIQIRLPRLLILDPKLSKKILVQNFKSFHDNEFSNMMDKKKDPLFSRNPFMLRGEEWKEKRAEVTPAFTNNRLKTLYSLIQVVQEQMTKYIKSELKKGKKDPFDIKDICGKYTTDVVSSCVYSADAQSFTNENSEIFAMGKKLMAPTGTFIFLMFLLGAVPFLKRFIKLTFVQQDVQLFFIDLMNQAIKYREDNNISREDFVDHLIELKNKKNISQLDMAAHTVTFLTDGFETSSIAISYAIYELGKNRNVQDKLRKEIRKCVDKNGEITFEALYDMSYLDQVFHETLRMHPPFTAISRECTVDTELISKSGQTVMIEKGINIYIPTYQLQHDPEYYPDPEEFIPERFGKENGGMKAFKDKGVFLTFGDGPRICLGMKFAQMQSKAAIVGILSNFRIKVNDKTQNPLVMDPKEFLNIKQGGLWLNFIPLEIKKTAGQ
ncbi:unnamed protein product [Diamesa hyperborea]